MRICLVEDKTIIELEAVKALINEHFTQILHYLKSTEKEIAFIINFGKSKLEYRCFNNRFI